MSSWTSFRWIAGALSLIAPTMLDAQQLIVQRNANLRRDPSTLHAPIRLVPAGDTIQLLTVHTTKDFLHVRAGKDTGWVFSDLVELLSLAASPAPTVAAVTSAPQDFHDCPIL